MLGQGFGDGDSRMKMKRKDLDLEDFSCELSDFSLTSPARKIRRLDAELAPIIEEELDIPVDVQHSQPEFDCINKTGVVIEELPSAFEENEERAIVLFNPANAPISRSPTNYAISVNPQFITSFKNDELWLRQSNERGAPSREELEQDKNKCLAVVPWVPSSSEAGNTKVEVSDMMEADEMEVERMEVEEMPAGFTPATGTNTNTNDGLHQWQMQQHHCLIPQPPQNISTPIEWYR